MATYKELIYLVLDEMKVTADDSFIVEEHVAFLLNKYRGLLLKRDYGAKKKEVALSNFLTLEIDLIQVPAIPDIPCEGGIFLRSKDKIPALLNIGIPKIYTANYYMKDITFVTKDRMRYVGNNRWLQNIIYASIGPDNYLYLKSLNAQYLHLKKANFMGLFEDPSDLYDTDDYSDIEFPLEETLIPELVQSIVKELSGVLYKPKDSWNNANDDLSDIMSFIRQNMKSNLLKLIEL